MLSFFNPGEIDPRMTQLFGVNVKETDSAIGFFGTGLKYAIAATLRFGGKVTMWSGLNEFQFSTRKTSIRGKEFDLVFMHGESDEITMPFTTELGKAWEPWMIYREFWANAKDEGGDTIPCHVAPKPGMTVFQIDCPVLQITHAKRYEFILEDSVPILTIPGVLEVHKPYQRVVATKATADTPPSFEVGSLPTQTIFYKGLKVYTTFSPGNYTYNLLGNVGLTEDRTIADWWSVQRKIVYWLAASGSKPILESVLISGNTYWEWSADWTFWNDEVIEKFRPVVIEVARVHDEAKLPSSVLKFLPTRRLAGFEPNLIEQEMLKRALTFCHDLGFTISQEIICIENLGENILGKVMGDKIAVSREAFGLGTKALAGTLLEEHLHIVYKLRDNSTGMQNFLVNLVMSLGERIMGEPI